MNKGYGTHVMGSFYSENLNDPGFVSEAMFSAASAAKLNVLKIVEHKFDENGGVSIVFVLAESHMSIHTWPEDNWATLDCYTCGDRGDPVMAFEYVVDFLLGNTKIKHIFER